MNHAGPRLLERRRKNRMGPAQPLRTALRQLRIRASDARGADGVGEFVDRLRDLVALACFRRQSEVAYILARLAISLERGRDNDMRELIYVQLTRATCALQGDN